MIFLKYKAPSVDFSFIAKVHCTRAGVGYEFAEGGYQLDTTSTL